MEKPLLIFLKKKRLCNSIPVKQTALMNDRSSKLIGHGAVSLIGLLDNHTVSFIRP